MKHKFIALSLMALLFISMFAGCSTVTDVKITSVADLSGKKIAVPTGSMADELVLSRVEDAEIVYFDTALACVQAVLDGRADAAAYDEPIMKNIVATTDGVELLSERITNDEYGYAVKLGNTELKNSIDELIAELKQDGTYDDMISRYLPEQGEPEAMPDIALDGQNGILRFGTASITIPFSFKNDQNEIVGFDIELARRLAQKLGMELQIVDMEFGELIAALEAGEVDMIGACITISEERATKVLFSEAYYSGGISAVILVKP